VGFLRDAGSSVGALSAGKSETTGHDSDRSARRRVGQASEEGGRPEANNTGQPL
jgi:hypothetical protein